MSETTANFMFVTAFCNQPKTEGANPSINSVVVGSDDVLKQVGPYFKVIVSKNKKYEDRRVMKIVTASFNEYSKPGLLNKDPESVAITGDADIKTSKTTNATYEESGVFALKDITDTFGKYFTIHLYLNKKDPSKMHVFIKKGSAEKYRPPLDRQKGNDQKGQGGAAGAAASGKTGNPVMY